MGYVKKTLNKVEPFLDGFHEIFVCVCVTFLFFVGRRLDPSGPVSGDVTCSGHEQRFSVLFVVRFRRATSCVTSPKTLSFLLQKRHQ